MGQNASAIKDKLTKAFSPTQLDIIDDSHKHAGHAGMAGRESSESHFKVVIIAPSFKGMGLLARHRAVMDALGDLMDERVHALSVDAKAE